MARKSPNCVSASKMSEGPEAGQKGPPALGRGHDSFLSTKDSASVITTPVCIHLCNILVLPVLASID